MARGLTAAEMRAIIQEELSAKLDPLNAKIDALVCKVAALSTEQSELGTRQRQQGSEIEILRSTIKVLEGQNEMLLKHSYSYDALIHGIEESDADDWQATMAQVKTFLTKRGLECFIAQIDGYGHRLGPRRSQPMTKQNPRPICIRLITKSAQLELVSSCNKRNSPKGEAYISDHLTKTQIAFLRDRRLRKQTQQEAMDTTSNSTTAKPSHLATTPDSQARRGQAAQYNLRPPGSGMQPPKHLKPKQFKPNHPKHSAIQVEHRSAQPPLPTTTPTPDKTQATTNQPNHER